MLIAIVEDEVTQANLIKTGIAQIGEEMGISVQAELFDKPLFFLDNYVPKYDAIFLDIEMPYCDGIETAKQIRKKDQETIIVFVTNMIQRAIDGYEVQALDFVIKPVTYERLKSTLLQVIRKLGKEKKEGIEVKTANQVVYLDQNEILYVEVSRHRLFFHLTSGKVIESWGNMSDIEKKFSLRDFSKCNNCYLVNHKYVKGISQDMVEIGDSRLKISRGRKKEFIENMLAYIG